jgi:hypothetical protein
MRIDQSEEDKALYDFVNLLYRLDLLTWGAMWDIIEGAHFNNRGRSDN